MARHGFLGRFYWNSPGAVVGVGGSSTEEAGVIASGYYFMQGYSSESPNNFIEALIAALTATGGTVSNAYLDCTLESPRLKIVFGGSTKMYLSSGLAAVLGFCDPASPAAYDADAAVTHTATYYPRYCWFPKSDVSVTSVDRTKFWEPLSSSKSFRSINGKCYGVKGNLLYGNRVQYTYLGKEEVITTSTDINQPFQRFFEDVIHETQRFRILLNRDIIGSSGYASTVMVTAMYGPNEDDVSEDVGSFSTFATQSMDSYQGLWDLELPMVKYV